MDPVTNKDMAFRKLCAERFTTAIVISVGLQYLLAIAVLIFVNFDLLHPMSWIADTMRLLLSPYTWLVSIPASAAFIFHGLALAKTCLLENRYYPTVFESWCRGLVNRSYLLLTAGIMGCLTALFFTRFLRAEYRLLVVTEVNDRSSTVNERFLYLLVSGLFAGSYFYFSRESDSLSTQTSERRVQGERKNFRQDLGMILFDSIRQSFVPTLIYLCFYYTLVWLFRGRSAQLLGKEVSTAYGFYRTATDLRLQLYTWLVFAMILAKMKLMLRLFRIFVYEPHEFIISVGSYQKQSKTSEPVLSEALDYRQIPVIQLLAAEDLCTIGKESNNSRRCLFYQLTDPGGHPLNWRHMCDTCLKLIRDFTHELHESIGGIDLSPSPPMVMMGGRLRPTTSTDIDRLLRQQYNQNFGIRSLSAPVLPNAGGTVPVANADICASLKNAISLTSILERFPIYQYLFVESKTAKSCHLLSVKSELIVKVTEGLSTLACHSLQEDQYGVVQDDLPNIVHVLLELKKVIEKISAIKLDVKKNKRNDNSIKGVVTNSLSLIGETFAPYLNDLVFEPNDLQALRGIDRD
ncbi:nucleoporin Ndc1 [Anopheles bellator]|uniref:nucleoporin Ndc1 n=1 Tax=Anopheles bellator TaxID=139047 RepID=UPI0026478F1B|nr:nucleoporin Ndc1 [Anopheles bellator]